MKDKTRTVDASELQNSYINLVAGDVVVVVVVVDVASDVVAAVCAFMYDLGDCEEEERQQKKYIYDKRRESARFHLKNNTLYS